MIDLRSLKALVCLLLTLPAVAQQGGDLQAQILYAFQTEDANRLTELAQNLSAQLKPELPDVNLRYHLAHAEYRIAKLAGSARGHEAGAALEDCIAQLKIVLKQDVKSVEAMALQSACYYDLAQINPLQASRLRARANDRLAVAFKLAPHNPRVVWLRAMDEMSQAKPGSEAQRNAFTQLQMAGQLFEQSAATNVEVPGWGHAETYLALAEQLQSRGDVLGARNWIEKALIVAPDFKAAQRQLLLIRTP